MLQRPKRLGTIGKSRSVDPNPSGCCETVRVLYNEDNTDAYEARPEVFQTFMIEPDLLNGRVHYTSEDRQQALSYCDGGMWVLQHVSFR